MSLPVYTSGCFELYRIKTDETKDFPEDILENQHMTIWYNEISVYDHTRYALSQSGREITMKIRIPQYKKIDSDCVCIIEGTQHRVYNAAHIINKDGLRLSFIASQSSKVNCVYSSISSSYAVIVSVSLISSCRVPLFSFFSQASSQI